MKQIIIRSMAVLLAAWFCMPIEAQAQNDPEPPWVLSARVIERNPTTGETLVEIQTTGLLSVDEAEVTGSLVNGKIRADFASLGGISEINPSLTLYPLHVRIFNLPEGRYELVVYANYYMPVPVLPAVLPTQTVILSVGNFNAVPLANPMMVVVLVLGV